MRLGHHERSRRSFDWRVKRLVERGLIVRHAASAFKSEFVYSISPDGATLLQATGECFVPLPMLRGKSGNGFNVLHAVELTEIHLTLLRSGLEFLWMPESEIRSRNELTAFGYAKDYDAVVSIRLDDRQVRFAVEYERTPKGVRQYQAIAEAVSRDERVEQVLYLVPNHDLLNFVSGFFRRIPRPVFFGLVSDWHTRLLNMSVLEPAAADRCRPLRHLLR